jgi:hypothetical protein
MLQRSPSTTKIGSDMIPHRPLHPIQLRWPTVVQGSEKIMANAWGHRALPLVKLLVPRKRKKMMSPPSCMFLV